MKRHYGLVNQAHDQAAELGMLDKASLALGKPTKKALEALEDADSTIALAHEFQGPPAGKQGPEKNLFEQVHELRNMKARVEQEKAEAALAQKQVQELRRELEAERRKAAKADELAELYRSGRIRPLTSCAPFGRSVATAWSAESLAAQVVQFAAQRSGLPALPPWRGGSSERLGQPGKHHIEARIERQGNDGVGQKAHVGAVVEPVIVKERVADKKQSKGGHGVTSSLSHH